VTEGKKMLVGQFPKIFEGAEHCVNGGNAYRGKKGGSIVGVGVCNKGGLREP